MKRIGSCLGMALGGWLFYRLGAFLVEACPRWPLALGMVLLLTMLAAVLLPGKAALWVEWLGTAGCLPVYLRVMPLWVFQLTEWTPELLARILYLVLGLFLAGLGPMVLFLLLGPLLDH